MGLILLAAPLLAILLFFLTKSKIIFHGISVICSLTLFVFALILTRQVLCYGSVLLPFLNGFFYVDALSMTVLDIAVFIGLAASVYSIGYLENESKHGEIDTKGLRLYYILFYAFIFTIMLALCVKNIGLMWIAIEGTTLASVFLVGFTNGKSALEASWKYIIICSVGIGLALLGIIFLHLSSVGVLSESQFLDWTALYQKADSLQQATLRLGFLFILVGFGTKAGLAPMHTWLPDAHSQAPSPISAMLSGVLLNGAMYAIMRNVAIVNKCLHGNLFTGRILIAVGVLSLLTAAIFILTQKDYKRLLAYSSIEHMGIISLGLGIFSPIAIFGALLHMVNHSCTKALLFFSSGNVLQKYGTREISKVRGLIKALPITGSLFFLGLFAISGTPPFSVFTSEFTILTATFSQHRFILGASVLLLLAAVFAGIAATMFKIFFGRAENPPKPGEINKAGTAVIIVLFVIIIAAGIFIPSQLKTLLTGAQQIITGGSQG